MFGGGGGGEAFPLSSIRMGLVGRSSLLLRSTSGIIAAIPPPPGAFPGQAGNPVGFAAAPGYPGSLTPWPGGGFTAGSTYKYFLFDNKTGSGTNVNAAGVTFIGCYFGNSSGNGSQAIITTSSGVNPTFQYCTYAPSPSVMGGSFPPLPPGGGGYTTWPSSTTSYIDGSLGYQYGPCGTGASTNSSITHDHCDMWGWANCCLFAHMNGTFTVTITDCWIHDTRNPSTYGDHTDGIGDIESSAGDSVHNVVINHCTIASLGNTQALAFQMQSTDAMTNVSVTNNYVAGFGNTINIGNVSGFTPSPYTGIVFTGNVIGTAPAKEGTDLYSHNSAPFNISGSGNKWRNNTYSGGPNDGKFLWPDGSINATDWTGLF